MTAVQFLGLYSFSPSNHLKSTPACALTGEAAVCFSSPLADLFAPLLSSGIATLPQGDTEVVAFHLPGQFAAAVDRAMEEERLLLVKGVAFGVDEEGARCATKGKW